MGFKSAAQLGRFRLQRINDLAACKDAAIGIDNRVSL
jgi:hypothetical protein